MHRHTRRELLLASLLSTSLLACTGDAQPVSPAGAAQAVNVAVTPSQVDVAPSATVAFAAVVTGTANTNVTWNVQEVDGGTVDAAGLYTAPGSAGTFHVVATSSADPTKQGAATVTVTAPPPPPPPPPPPGVAITIGPATGSVNACGTLQFTATVTGAADGTATWSVQEGVDGGTVSSSGLYTAPSGAGTYHVVATSAADPTKSAVAAVSVNEVILAVAVSPSTITLSPGGTAQFTATVTNTCGTFTATRTVVAP